MIIDSYVRFRILTSANKTISNSRNASHIIAPLVICSPTTFNARSNSLRTHLDASSSEPMLPILNCKYSSHTSTAERTDCAKYHNYIRIS